jgi:hypothetical protein
METFMRVVRLAILAGVIVTFREEYAGPPLRALVFIVLTLGVAGFLGFLADNLHDL